MDRRLLLPFVLTVGCAKGSLEGPGTFGVPNTSATQADPSNSDDDGDDDDDSESTGSNSGGGTAASEESTGSPISGPQEGSSGSASATMDPSAEGESSSSDPASASMTDASASADDGVDPPAPDAGPWENCQNAACDPGTDCITVNGLASDAYCAPQCMDDFDCPYPDTGDAEPYCLLVAEGAVDPTNCALVCEVDGLDYGTCPNGMSCSPIPGQVPSISLCMW